LLYRYEAGLAELAARLGREADASAHREQAAQRKRAIDRYLWSEQDGSYQDYDFVQSRRNAAPYISAFYPLWAGAASPAQARAMQQQVAALERKGGLAMSADTSGAQWDAPYGWAPTNWLAIEGLRANGYIDDARRLAGKFSATIDRALAHDGTIREKYNMDTGDATVNISAGYSDNVIGFGWSNGVYLRLQPLLSAPVTAR
jgi:alpha,alpha-trehalase